MYICRRNNLVSNLHSMYVALRNGLLPPRDPFVLTSQTCDHLDDIVDVNGDPYPYKSKLFELYSELVFNILARSIYDRSNLIIEGGLSIGFIRLVKKENDVGFAETYLFVSSIFSLHQHCNSRMCFTHRQHTHMYIYIYI